MKLQSLGKFFLFATVLLLLGRQKNAAADNLAVFTVSLETVTRVRQMYNPGLGSNYLQLQIEGKSGGNSMNVNISANSPGWAGQKLIDSCEKNAMLVLHYPSRYGFEVISGDTGQDGNVNLSVSDSSSDNAICGIKIKSPVIDLKPPVSNFIKSVAPPN